MRKTATKVKINKKTLSRSLTKARFGLDIRTGHMERMCGEIFTVNQPPSELCRKDRVRIWCEPAGRGFTFSMEDVSIIPDKLEPIPKPVMFDPKRLDVE